METDSQPQIPVTAPLRFCMVTTFYPPWHFGGDAIFVENLARALVTRGHQVTVVHCIDAFHASGGKEASGGTFEHPNLEVISLRSRVGFLSPLYTHQTSRPGFKTTDLRRILSPGRFDVIHFHNVSLVGGAHLLSFGDAVKLYTTHEHWLLCPLSTLWKYDREPCTRRDCIRCTLRAGRPPQWWRYSGSLEQNLAVLDAVLAPSQFMIRKHREMGVDVPFIHLPNFTPDPQSSLPDMPAQPQHHQPYFFMAGRLEKKKGFHRAIEMFRSIEHAQLIIAGSGTYESELRALAGDNQRVAFLGRVDGGRLAQLYRHATAVIVPSIWDEPFGLIVPESLAQRTPVIVNEAGALPELARDSGGGLTYSNEAEFQRSVIRILEDRSYRDQLGDSGHAYYLQHWSEESHLRSYLNVVEDIRRARTKPDRSVRPGGPR